ncbi:MAG TPA: hypothetical protein VKY85_15955 [Candidatus Angelobacter sp.]|nr:hypothetical protein [Candidatus Angelobacter sp.]
MKASIYESLHAISQAAEQISQHIERLKAEGVLAPALADIRKLAIKQLRAEVSLNSLLILVDREQ